MTVSYRYLTPPIMQFSNAGVPVSGGKLFTYIAGTSTKTNTFSDNSGTVMPNPIILDTQGRVTSNGTTISPLFGQVGQSYKLVLSPSTDTDPPTSPIWTADNQALGNNTTVIDPVNNAPVIVASTPGVGTPVNYIEVTNAMTGNDPEIQAAGTDTDITLDILGKGADGVKIGSPTGHTAVSLTYNGQVQNHTATLTAPRTVTWPDSDIGNAIVQRVGVVTGAVATGTTVIPGDDTIPQITEGDSYMSIPITPKNTANILVIEVVWFGSSTSTAEQIVALFQDSTANALAAVSENIDSSGSLVTINLKWIMTAGTTSSTTFRVRAGNAGANTTTFNGVGGSRRYGGVAASSITITEYAA